MEIILPFLIICIAPVGLLALGFYAGRWSTKYKISVSPKTGGSYTEAYEEIEEV